MFLSRIEFEELRKFKRLDDFNFFHVHTDYFLLVLDDFDESDSIQSRSISIKFFRIIASTGGVLIPNQLSKTVLVKLENKHVLSSSRIFLRSS